MSSIYMEKSYPKEVDKAKKERWPVILPVGTMEYHSAHCPYGCDTLVAKGIAEKLGEKTDCMILPPIWYGVASYAVGGPETNTINVSCDTLEEYVYDILKSLFKSGFTRNVCIILFHQTEDFLPTALACMKAAKKLTFEYLEENEGYGWWGDNKYANFYDNLSKEDSPWNWIRVFNGVYFPERYEYPGDHAGKFESAKLESLYPGSIKLERLDETDDWFSKNAREMSVKQGAEIVEKIVENLYTAIKEGKKCY